MNISAIPISYPEDQTIKKRTVVVVLGLSVLAAILTFIGGLPSTLALILAAEIGFFLMAFYRPVWAVASLLVGQLTASNYMFFISTTAISSRFLWTILAVFLLVFLFLKEGKLKIGKEARYVIIPAIFFFIFSIIANAVNTDMAFTLQYLRLVATSLIILIVVPVVVKDERDIKTLALVALVTCAISAVYAIVQHYHIRILPFSTTIYGYGFEGRRAWGLMASPVLLGYTLPLVIISAVCLLLHKSISRRYWVILILAVLLITAGTYFTYTRSAMYSFGFGLAAMVLFMRLKIKKELFLIAIVIVSVFLIYTDTKQNRYTQGVSDDTSAAGRLVLWQAGSQIAMDNPIVGIGGRDFKAVSESYAASVEVNTALMEAEDVLGIEQPHNDFLRVWISYGTPALIAFLFILFGIFRNFYVYYKKTSNRFLRGIAFGLFAALVTYSVNAAFHNVMDSVSLMWIIGGISIALFKLGYGKEKQPADVKA